MTSHLKDKKRVFWTILSPSPKHPLEIPPSLILLLVSGYGKEGKDCWLGSLL